MFYTGSAVVTAAVANGSARRRDFLNRTGLIRICEAMKGEDSKIAMRLRELMPALTRISDHAPERVIHNCYSGVWRPSLPVPGTRTA